MLIWFLLLISNSHICTINIGNWCLRNLRLWDWNKIIQLHRSTAVFFKHCMASLAFLHQLVNEKMEAVQVWERRTIKKLHVQVLLQTLKMRARDPAQLQGWGFGNPARAVLCDCTAALGWLQTPLVWQGISGMLEVPAGWPVGLWLQHRWTPEGALGNGGDCSTLREGSCKTSVSS